MYIQSVGFWITRRAGFEIDMWRRMGVRLYDDGMGLRGVERG